MRQGEVPNGRGVSTAHADRLVPRNTRNRPDAGARPATRALSPDPPEHRCGPAASVGFRLRGQGAASENGTSSSDRGAVPALPGETDPGREDPGGTVSCGGSQPLSKGVGTGAARGIRRCFEQAFFPSPAAMVAGRCGPRRLDRSRALLRLPANLSGLPPQFPHCPGTETGRECETVTPSAGNGKAGATAANSCAPGQPQCSGDSCRFCPPSSRACFLLRRRRTPRARGGIWPEGREAARPRGRRRARSRPPPVSTAGRRRPGSPCRPIWAGPQIALWRKLGEQGRTEPRWRPGDRNG